MKSKQNTILEEIYQNNKTQKQIADSLNVSESYVSQIVGKARMLRIPLKFIKGKLVCSKCEKENEHLVFHHNHSTGEYIALVCESCNRRFYKNDFEYYEGDCSNRKMHYPVVITVRISHKTKENLDKVVKVMDLPYSEMIRIILEDYLK